MYFFLGGVDALLQWTKLGFINMEPNLLISWNKFK